MKRVAALFAVMSAMTAVVPATAPAATGVAEDKGLCLVLAVRIC